jgi:hypothetical protein
MLQQDAKLLILLHLGVLTTHRYQKGHDQGELEPKISPARTDLWEFRLAHAKGRIAARRGAARSPRPKSPGRFWTAAAFTIRKNSFPIWRGTSLFMRATTRKLLAI